MFDADHVFTEDKTPVIETGIIDTGNGKIMLHSLIFEGAMGKAEMPNQVVVTRIGGSKPARARYGDLSKAEEENRQLKAEAIAYAESLLNSMDEVEIARKSLETRLNKITRSRAFRIGSRICSLLMISPK